VISDLSDIVILTITVVVVRIRWPFNLDLCLTLLPVWPFDRGRRWSTWSVRIREMSLGKDHHRLVGSPSLLYKPMLKVQENCDFRPTVEEKPLRRSLNYEIWGWITTSATSPHILNTGVIELGGWSGRMREISLFVTFLLFFLSFSFLGHLIIHDLWSLTLDPRLCRSRGRLMRCCQPNMDGVLHLHWPGFQMRLPQTQRSPLQHSANLTLESGMQ